MSAVTGMCSSRKQQGAYAFGPFLKCAAMHGANIRPHRPEDSDWMCDLINENNE